MYLNVVAPGEYIFKQSLDTYCGHPKKHTHTHTGNVQIDGVCERDAQCQRHSTFSHCSTVHFDNDVDDDQKRCQCLPNYAVNVNGYCHGLVGKLNLAGCGTRDRARKICRESSSRCRRSRCRRLCPFVHVFPHFIVSCVGITAVLCIYVRYLYKCAFVRFRSDCVCFAVIYFYAMFVLNNPIFPFRVQTSKNKNRARIRLRVG